MSDLAELIARVEKLTGPDRRIDSCIEVACGFAISREGAGMARYERGPKGRRNRVPHYTASVDVAIALAERLGFVKQWTVDNSSLERPQACVGTHIADGATPVLALLLALLKAKDSPNG